MVTFPLNYIIFTTTRGHFERHDIYKETANDLNKQFPLEIFRQRYASIKVSPESEAYEHEMLKFFIDYSFKPQVNNGAWKHNDQSHQTGYLYDLLMMFMRDDVNECQYTLITEDDFLIRAHSKDLEYWFDKSIKILEKNSKIVQVRIPRFKNEFARIKGLNIKHGIDGKAGNIGDSEFFVCNDWSNNVYIARTRDVRTAIALINMYPNLFGTHSEHSLSRAMKYFSFTDMPFAILNPEMISCYHRGTPIGQEDDVNKEILAT